MPQNAKWAPLGPAKALSHARPPRRSPVLSRSPVPTESHLRGSVPRRSTAPYLRVALSPCRTVTLSIALGKVASPLRTGTPVGTRNSSLRDTTTRHFQGWNRDPQTPILDSHNFPELRRRLGPRPPPRTRAGLGQPRGEGGRGWNQPEAERGVRRSGVQALRSLLFFLRSCLSFPAWHNQMPPPASKKALSRCSPGEEGGGREGRGRRKVRG